MEISEHTTTTTGADQTTTTTTTATVTMENPMTFDTVQEALDWMARGNHGNALFRSIPLLIAQ